jgi:hypothetical protein
VVFILELFAVCGFVLVADRIVYWTWRRTRYQHARRTADYPLTDPTNWRQPSNHNLWGRPDA